MDNKYVAGKVGKQTAYTTASGAIAIMIVYLIWGESLSPVIFASFSGGISVALSGVAKFFEKIGLVDALKRVIGNIGKK